MDGTRENKHGGLLICASAVSQGATFTIKLPIGRGA
jgi:signal transduction histidine kinase